MKERINIPACAMHAGKQQRGETLHFTDGYIDQFGGKNKRKFSTAPFRDLLFTIHDKSMDEQKKILETKFNSWKGSLEQIDDVLIFGFRI
jgi:hypothetical protein